MTDAGTTGDDPQSGVMPIDARIFAFTGVFFAGTAVVYGVLAEEWAGVVLLAVAAFFSVTVFGFLLARGRGHTTDTRANAPHDARHEAWFPGRSIWPLGVGGGLALLLTGLAVGLPVLVAGVVLFLRSAVGWAYQSKVRA